MIQRVLERVLAIELILVVLLPFVAWIASMMGADVQNLFAEEGFRWFCFHIEEMLLPPAFSLCLFFLVDLGMVLQLVCTNHRAQHRRAFLRSSIVGIILLLLLLMPILLNYSPLLSITGDVYLSPWSSLFPYALCLIVLIISLFFALQTNQLKSVEDLSLLLTCGIRRFAILIPIFVIAYLHYYIVLYCFYQ